jgi:SOS-response transcriptional repressor LexA
MEMPITPTITVRPSKELRPALLQLAKDLDKSEGQILLECTAAILEMLDSGEDRVPQLVRAARVLREHNATYSEPAHLIGGKHRRDKREVSLYSEIRAGHPSAICAEAPPEKIRLPANLARHADFAVTVRGDSMEPMVSEGDIAVFRASETAGNGQFVAAVIDGQMLLKRFVHQSKGPARLESLNPAYPPIPWSEEARIQGVFEGKFNPKSKH